MSYGENKTPLRVLKQDEWGIKSDARRKRVCHNCGKEYFVSMGEVEYKIKEYHFCSYNCRSKFKKHQKIRMNQTKNK